MLPCTRLTRAPARRAADPGIDPWTIADGLPAPVAGPARHVLLACTETPSYFQSVTGAIALGETLLQTIVSLGGERVLARLRTVQGHREVEHAYVDPATAARRYIGSS
ncbi:MAG: hypothetical protein M9951_16020 [Burkholderiaceae bacterium]|nr:hypothetical protein [Burkholderiaceae bacterium]